MIALLDSMTDDVDACYAAIAAGPSVDYDKWDHHLTRIIERASALKTAIPRSKEIAA